MTFHRLALPPSASYYLRGNPGPLLPGYDYINDPVGNVTGTTPTPVDTSYKSSGLYQGTYLVAFGEDATASNTNRGLYALAQGQDLMDDYLNESLPRVVTLQVTVPAGPGLATLALTGTIFVGGTGTVNNQPNRDLLVHVLGFTLNEVEVPGVYPAGTRVTVALIHDGASNNVVGTTLSGFYTNPSIDLNVTLPPGTYNIIVGVQTSFADQVISNKAGVIGTGIRGDTGVHADAQRLLRTLHSTVTAPWDANWATTIAALAASGLDGRYRHSTAEPGSLQLDTAGAGAVITRDGAAPEVITTSVPAAYVDPINAHWITRHGGSRGNAIAVATPDKSATGFVAYSSRRNLQGNLKNETGAVLGASSFLSVWPHDFSGAIATAKTYVQPGVAGGVVNYTGLGQDIIRLPVGQFFYTGGKTAVSQGYDLIEITVAGTVYTYVIVALDAGDPRKAKVRTLGGSVPTTAFAGDTAVTSFRWMSLQFQQGGGAAHFQEVQTGDATPVSWDSFSCMSPVRLTSGAAELSAKSAEFFAAVPHADYLGTDTSTAALKWGGFDDTFPGAGGKHVANGQLTGDGSVVATGFTTRAQSIVINPGPPVPIIIDLSLGATIQIHLVGGSISSLTVDNGFGGIPVLIGQHFEIFFIQGGGGGFTCTFGTAFKFSDNVADRVLEPGVGAVTKYVCQTIDNGFGGASYYVDKTIYL